MPDIKYVVVSDMHLGAENSILTYLRTDVPETDTSKPSAALVKLCECLREVLSKNTNGKKPTLVMNGDLMELALTTTNNAVNAMQRLIELLVMENGEFLFDDEILFLPGNHDHNLWERSRGEYYVQYLLHLKAGDDVSDEIHSTNLMNPERVTASLVDAVVDRFLPNKNVRVLMNYPARAVCSDDGKKCVIFCHGHYVESMYSLMTSLRSHIFPDRVKPRTLAELETENYAWVDFFWSDLGRSGSVGKDINLIYDKIQDPAQVKSMISNIAHSYTSGNQNLVKRWAETALLEEMLNVTVGRLASSERNEPEVALTPDATLGLKEIMECYLYNEIMDELGGIVPEDITFIFGHTHKPFQRLIPYAGYKYPARIYNSGGWVVDTTKQQPLHGGSVILVDETLDTVSLNFYREGNTEITVSQLTQAGEATTALYDHIKSTIDMQREPWAGFARAAVAEINHRYEALGEIIKSDN